MRNWTGSSSNWEASEKIARDAINAADAYVKYSDYDTMAPFGVNTPAELHLTVIPAGYHASTGCSGADEIWGHRGKTGSDTPTVDGVTVGGGNGDDGGYTMVGEMHCNWGDHMATLGEIAHENGLYERALIELEQLEPLDTPTLDNPVPGSESELLRTVRGAREGALELAGDPRTWSAETREDRY